MPEWLCRLAAKPPPSCKATLRKWRISCPNVDVMPSGLAKRLPSGAKPLPVGKALWWISNLTLADLKSRQADLKSILADLKSTLADSKFRCRRDRRRAGTTIRGEAVGKHEQSMKIDGGGWLARRKTKSFAGGRAAHRRRFSREPALSDSLWNAGALDGARRTPPPRTPVFSESVPFGATFLVSAPHRRIE